MTLDDSVSIAELKDAVRDFCAERDWDQFHDAKELAISISTEAAELLEHFRYRDPDAVQELMEDPGVRKEVEHEIADVLFLTLRLAERYDIDVGEAFQSNIDDIADKYPVEASRGRADKYTAYRE